jgi:exodeoxyribonuclease V gamma subunit
MTTSDIQPGLIILHGNRLELLRDTVIEWLQNHPLEPLEEEMILVQSNGTAEWLKASFAADLGICAATCVELPGRFLWRLYRQVLGKAEVPSASPLDKDALTWRLMRLLLSKMHQPGFESIASFLVDGDPERLLQLAQRLAKQYDEYQIYRADWLDAWAQDSTILIDPLGHQQPLPEDQKWQAWLWRDVLAELSTTQLRAVRPQIHRDVLAQLNQQSRFAESIPRRVVLFGTSSIPGATLDALVALSRHSQVLITVLNPCRYHWADIIEGRELLRSARRRFPLRADCDLSVVSMESMHTHAHPLLAAWGRQGRDFMRQLDVFDNTSLTQAQFALPRIDLFDESHEKNLLAQVQDAIRDLVPLNEHSLCLVDPTDHSIDFHVVHNIQREVEVLHDQLLRKLAEPPSLGKAPLRPQDIIVMVPDIEMFSPAIRAVFGQYTHSDPRYIPFDIADTSGRGSSPMMLALEWLLNINRCRIGMSEVRDLLDVPAIAARFGLGLEDGPRLALWMMGSGIRWGLDAQQRESIGLGACGEQNSWIFGLRRMLLGYASGEAQSFDAIEPYDEIGGLDASLVGILADVLDRMDKWWKLSCTLATPQFWAERGRALLDAWMVSTDERERTTQNAMQDALDKWLNACERASFTTEVPLSVFREGWLSGLDEPEGAGRFLAGGVTFCSLMPLRAIPFEVVCLLGMNDGDYPRQNQRNDFDLMRQKGQYRPGDRSRRDDDRYLMLEALLSARRFLYISWSGRSSRDNSHQPPSVLVTQLQEYLAAGWKSAQNDLLAQITTVHPLQPFSRRYFEGKEMFTYAREWRAAHNQDINTSVCSMPTFDDAGVELSFWQLTRFLKNPVKNFFRVRLDVVFDEAEAITEDDEVFSIAGLARYSLLQDVLANPMGTIGTDPSKIIQHRLLQISGAGRLPMGELGDKLAQDVAAVTVPMLQTWQDLFNQYSLDVSKVSIRAEHDGVVLDDWLDGLRGDGKSTFWIGMTPSGLIEGKNGKRRARSDKLIDFWVRMLASSAVGQNVTCLLIGQDAVLTLPPLPQDEAITHLHNIFDAWRTGMKTPLPWVARTALVSVEGGNAKNAYQGSFNSLFSDVDEPCLARIYPDYGALIADGQFEIYADKLFKPLSNWAKEQVQIHDLLESAQFGETTHV